MTTRSRCSALLLAACCAVSTRAFTAPALLGSLAARRTSLAPATPVLVTAPRYPARRSAAAPPRGQPLRAGVPVEAAKLLLAVPTMYALMSANEYFTHRYYQHAEYNKASFFQALARVFSLPSKIRGGGHVEHHAETYDDMLLKTDDAQWMKSPAAQSLNGDPWRGTAFTWQVTGMMFAQMVPTTFPVFMGLFHFSFTQTLSIFVPAMILHGLVWNALHPNMHGLPDVPLSVGLPSKWLAFLRNTWYFKYLYQNHEGHHVVGGQGNYNVACPLVDHLVGSYHQEAHWRPKVNAFLAKANKKALISDAAPALALA